MDTKQPLTPPTAQKKQYLALLRQQQEDDREILLAEIFAEAQKAVTPTEPPAPEPAR